MERFSRRKFLSLTGTAILTVIGLNKVTETFADENILDVKVMMYHEVTPSKLTSDLMSHMNQGYQPISEETFIYGLRNQIVIPKSQKFFLLTLDDGRLSQYQSVIQATDYIQNQTGWFVPAIFFIQSRFGEIPQNIKDIPENIPSYESGNNQYMTKDQLLDLLSRGHSLENHTINHADLIFWSATNIGVRNDEVVNGENRVQALWDIAEKRRTFKTFAYPYGYYNDEQISLMDGLKYDLAFSTRQTTIHTPDDIYKIGRIRMT